MSSWNTLASLGDYCDYSNLQYRSRIQPPVPFRLLPCTHLRFVANRQSRPSQVLRHLVDMPSSEYVYGAYIEIQEGECPIYDGRYAANDDVTVGDLLLTILTLEVTLAFDSPRST
jgi:hypothetical protein